MATTTPKSHDERLEMAVQDILTEFGEPYGILSMRKRFDAGKIMGDMAKAIHYLRQQVTYQQGTIDHLKGGVHG